MNQFDKINVIPFIDIMLVLLAIVLTTASFISTGLLKIKLPEATNSASFVQSTDILEIAIDKDQNIFIEEQAVDFALFKTRISDVKPGTTIQLRIDEQARFGKFIQIMDILKNKGLEKLSVITRKN